MNKKKEYLVKYIDTYGNAIMSVYASSEREAVEECRSLDGTISITEVVSSNSKR